MSDFIFISNTNKTQIPEDLPKYRLGCKPISGNTRNENNKDQYKMVNNNEQNVQDLCNKRKQ